MVYYFLSMKNEKCIPIKKMICNYNKFLIIQNKKDNGREGKI